jgi:peroxiredoxin
MSMVKTPSTMVELGTESPSFSLLDPVTGRKVCRDDFAGAQGLLVAFLCNHCPFVKHIAGAFAAFAVEYQERGLAIVGINSNDVETHPEDSSEHMVAEAGQRGYTFPYLVDESQEIAKSYRAACTPDFFLFDNDFRLVYRGQFDRSRPSLETPVTGTDLRDASDAVLAGITPADIQIPSVGCNIKWKPGNAPDWVG